MSPASIENRQEVQSNEVVIGQLLATLIRRKNKSFEAALADSKWSNFVRTTIPPRNSTAGLNSKKYIPETLYEEPLFFKVIDFYFYWLVLYQYQVDIYAAGLSQLKNITPLNADNSPFQSFADYKYNDHKMSYVEFYNINQFYAINKPIKAELGKSYSFVNELYIKRNVNNFYNYHKLMCLPDTYGKSDNIVVKDILWILSFLSNHIMCSKRMLSTETGLLFYFPRKEKEWLKHFKEGYITRYSEKNLLDKLVRVTQWERERIKIILNFITLDLKDNNQKENTSFYSRPMLKLDDNYYWSASLLRDRNWGNILYTRISAEKLQKDPKKQATQLENEIATWFKAVAYKGLTEADRKYNFSENGTKIEGEFDGVFYSEAENVLFVLELKTAYFGEDIIKMTQYAQKRFEQEAAAQIERGLKELDIHREKYQQLLNLKNDTKVIGLIVSNLFAADKAKINNKFLKISIWELRAILTNTKEYFYNEPLTDEFKPNYLHANKNSPYRSDKNLPINLKAWAGDTFKYTDLTEGDVWDVLPNVFDSSKHLGNSNIKMP